MHIQMYAKWYVHLIVSFFFTLLGRCRQFVFKIMAELQYHNGFYNFEDKERQTVLQKQANSCSPYPLPRQLFKIEEKERSRKTFRITDREVSFVLSRFAIF